MGQKVENLITILNLALDCNLNLCIECQGLSNVDCKKLK